MPEGPAEFPRLTNLGPFSRQTKEEVIEQWRDCPESGKQREICRTIKRRVLIALESEGIFPDCEDLVDINSGRCHDIARSVKGELGYVDYVETQGGDHGWIRHKGVHYDAERPDGVYDPFDLPFFARFSPHEILTFARQHARARDEPYIESIEDLIVEGDR